LKVILYQNNKIESAERKPTMQLLPLLNKIQYFNFLTNENHTLSVPLRKSCPCHQTQFSLDDISEIVSPGCDIDVNYENFLDVRELDEWSQYHLKNSQHWALSKMLANDFPMQYKEKKLILICRSGGRAQKAMELMKQQGFLHLSLAKKGVYEYQN
jgi:rhodanese-related sulfurtransferase